MKVRIYGFEWMCGMGISLTEFVNYLTRISGKEIENKVIGLQESDKYWNGLIVAIKDVKQYCEMKKSGRKFTITPKKLEANSNIADFNFFILNKETGRGLYQHYHQSTHSNTFGVFGKRRYANLKGEKIQEGIIKAGGNDIAESRKRIIKNMYKGNLKHKTLVRPENFDKCVESMAMIKEFSYEFDTFTVDEPTFRTLNYAKRCSQKVFFNTEYNCSNIKESILDTMKSFSIRRARVYGSDEHGALVDFKFLNDYLMFDEYDYDEIISHVEVDSENLVDSIKNSGIITLLHEIANRSEIKTLLTVKERGQ